LWTGGGSDWRSDCNGLATERCSGGCWYAGRGVVRNPAVGSWLEQCWGALDLAANNLANVSTTGYKPVREFYRSFAASARRLRLTPLTAAGSSCGKEVLEARSERGDYCNFAYSALACRRMGMSGSTSFHSVRKS
jgi:Flagella basal body rod protein